MNDEPFPEVVIGFNKDVRLPVRIEICKEELSTYCTGKYIPTPLSPDMCIHCMKVLQEKRELST